MKNQLISEWLKLSTVRSPVISVAGVFAFVLVIAGLASATIPPGGGPGADIHMVLGITGGTLPALVMVVVGLLSVGSEFHNKAIIGTYLFTPKRSRVLTGKLVVIGALGVVVGAACVAATLALSLPILHLRDVPSGLETPAALAGHVVSCVAVTTLGAVLGVGLGFCFRNPVFGIVAFLGWTSIGEGIVGVLVPEALLPTGAMRVAVTGSELVPAWVSVVALVLYAVLAAGLAHRVYVPKDITA